MFNDDICWANLIKKIWCASRARVNLSHIGNNFFYNKPKFQPFLDGICMGFTLIMLNFYTVIKNFGFSLPKHSVLKNLPKLPIIQQKFRVKSTKHSSQSQCPRSFVFKKFFKFNSKLRYFQRNISDIGQWVTYYIRSTIFRSNQLAAWSVGLRCWLWVQNVPNRPEKKNKKSKFYQAIRNQNQNFHGFIPESTTETSGLNFPRNFERPKLRVLQKTRNHARSFGWAETGEILEVSGEKKLLRVNSELVYYAPGSQNYYQKCRQLCSRVKCA
jgi:hypothetical protein